MNPPCTRMYTHPFFEAIRGRRPRTPGKKPVPVFVTSGGVTKQSFYDPTMSRVDTTMPVSVAFCCALANGECCSQPTRYRMISVVAGLSAVRASGFRQSVQFGFSGNPEGWVCSDHALGAMWRVPGPGLAAMPKSRSDSLLMDVPSLLASTRAAASC